MSLRDHLDTLSRAELAGLSIVLVVTLAGMALWYARSLPKPVAIAQAAAPPQVPPTGAVAAGSPVESPPFAGASGSGSVVSPPVSPSLIVDVTGLVRRPGVYEFEPGARVVDAVERAGGPRRGADLSLLNLAAPLVDGQQVVVPKQGASSTAPGATPGIAAPSGTDSGLINVNTASETELEEVSGVGEVLAAAIVAYREEHGPFTSVDQLEDVSGIGPATLEEMRDQVTI